MSDAREEGGDRYAHRLLLRVTEAAEILALSRTRVYELMMAGEIESLKIGGVRRIPREAVSEFVARLRSRGGDVAV